jgi:divalent metal cation (Fe/Co/Zn/Cd) transporter
VDHRGRAHRYHPGLANRLRTADPLIAIVVAVNILVTGYRLLIHSGKGLMDIALPVERSIK